MAAGIGQPVLDKGLPMLARFSVLIREALLPDSPSTGIRTQPLQVMTGIA